MTNPASPTEPERCPDCLWPMSKSMGQWRTHCTARVGSWASLCTERTIARLRAELASVRALSAHNEDAARLLRVLGGVVFTRHMGGESNVVAVAKWLDDDEALRKDTTDEKR